MTLASTNQAPTPPRQDEVEAVYDEVRWRILHNELFAGERINQAVLARDLQVSRGPVREALRLLQREGLVEHVHQHQMRVSSVSVRDLDELYAMRICLETFALRISVPRLTDEELGILEQALVRMEQLAGANDIDQWEVAHSQFHAQLVRHAGSRIASSIHDLSEHCARYRRIYIQGEPRAWAQGAAEHAGIVEAATAGKPELAAERLGLHLGRTALTVVAIVSPQYEPATVRDAIRSVACDAQEPS